MSIQYEGGFPSGKDREMELAANAEQVKRFRENAQDLIENNYYTWKDSPLDEDEERQVSFRTAFYPVLPEKFQHSLKEYIEVELSERKGKAVGVEFGGTGSRVFSEFTPGFFKNTVGVTLIDHRSKMGKLLSGDGRRNHEVIEGDILSPDTYDALNEATGGKKANLIMERMGRGLELVPDEPYYVAKILNIWYQILNEGGVMFVQVPAKFSSILKKWGELMEEYKDTIELQYFPGFIDTDGMCLGSFRLKKLKGAPKDLPLLNPRDLKYKSTGILEEDLVALNDWVEILEESDVEARMLRSLERFE